MTGTALSVLCRLAILAICSSVAVNWVDDNIDITTSIAQIEEYRQTQFNIIVNANGLIYEEKIGHVKIKMDYNNVHGLAYTAQTECIDLTWPGERIENQLKRAHLYQIYTNGTENYIDEASGPAFKVSDLYLTSAKRYFNNYTVAGVGFATDNHFSFDTTFELLFGRRKNVSDSLQVSALYDDCSLPRVIGLWDDPQRWDLGTVPSDTDDVYFSEKAGVVRISRNATARSLTMYGGLILNYDTYCPQGWSAEPEGQKGIKCYKLFESPAPFDAAERTCNAEVGAGTSGRHLMHIRDRAELLTATRLCRGFAGSAAHSKGCWIGLRDPLGTGNFSWISPVGLGTKAGGKGKFLDWRREEPNNHSISEGVPAGVPVAGGERCVNLVPWQEDPLLQEQGAWNDESCTIEKPFLCQVYGDTERYWLTVTGDVVLNAGALEGGVLLTSSEGGATSLSYFIVTRSGRLQVSSKATACVVGTVMLSDGATLSLNANARVLGFIGELTDHSASMVDPASPSLLPMQSFLHVSANATINFAPLCAFYAPTECSTADSGVIIISARAFVDGRLNITGNTTVTMLQGAEMSAAEVAVHNADSRLRLFGYNSRLSTYDAYEVQVSHRGEVVGEFYRDLAKEQRNLHLQERAGVYRLRIAHAWNSTRYATTQCIPYNATAHDLKLILDDLPIVQDRGRTTVRRYGSPTDSDFLFGYTYRIEMDAVATRSHAQGPLSFSIQCYGFDDDCGCAETKVVLVDVTGIPQCNYARENRTSMVDPNTCVLAPRLTINPLSRLAHTATSGAGSIDVLEGVHRLPPLSKCTLAVTAGTGVVASDFIDWHAIAVTGQGRLVVAGTGWDAWDASYSLYLPEWFTMRGMVRRLSHAPASNMFVQHFLLDGFGSVLSACPTSNMTWTNGTWAGGIIGGRSTLFLKGNMLATGVGKSLRYGLTLVVQPTATVQWVAGNVSLGDGADIIVEGTFRIDTAATGNGVFIGEAQLLEAPAGNAAALALLRQEAGRNWHSYYGDELPAELRGGWYQNPLCGDQCMATNHLIIRRNGSVALTDNSEVTFSLPLDLIGQSTLDIGANVTITLASGGICGNDVVIDISTGTILELSGGQMLMQATCTIQGEGELLVTAGSHDLSFSIDAHITIQGGSMVWPLSRGTDQVITFNGGLLMEKTGELQVNPFSTTIKIKKEVYLRDQSLIQFPLIGIAAQASLFDEQDAPDSSPRGNLIAEGIMRWEGGTLRGKADFSAGIELYLDGGAKYIKSLAKLVNRGHCEWGTGDLISSDSGDFLNLGTVQMKYGVRDFFSNAMYQGTELPVENGGDVFALEYHSWDMDNGGLDYTKYVKERTQFVSRAPNGWTVASQG